MARRRRRNGLARRRNGAGAAVGALVLVSGLAVAGFVGWKLWGGSMDNGADEMKAIVAAYPASASVVTRLIALADSLGVKARWIANVIQFESGWNPAARNPRSSATGLIQFMDATAKGLGTTTAALYTMPISEQWKYVEAYFRPFAGKLHSQADVFMAVFYPAAIGKEGFTFSAAVQAANPGIATPADYATKALRLAKLVP